MLPTAYLKPVSLQLLSLVIDVVPKLFLNEYYNIVFVNIPLFLLSGSKYEPTVTTSGYKNYMKLTINSVTPEDYGKYKCVSKNSLGDSEGTIQLFGKFSNYEFIMGFSF